MKVHIVFKHALSPYGLGDRVIPTGEIVAVYADPQEAQAFIDAKNDPTGTARWSVKTKIVKRAAAQKGLA